MRVSRSGLKAGFTVAFALAFSTLCMTAVAQSPVADYRFNHSLVDSLGQAPALVPSVPGDGGFVPVTLDGVLTTARMFSEGAGFVLDVEDVLPGQSYTIAVLVRLDRTGDYAKIVDTKALQSDTGLYAVAEALYVYPADVYPPEGVFLPDTWHHVVMTRSETGAVSAYLDGVVQLSFDDSVSNFVVISPERLLAFFQDDNMTIGEHSAGTVARIRLFDTALSPGQVADLEIDRAGDRVFANGFQPAS